MTGLWVVLGVLAAGLLAGFVLQAREGRIRGGSDKPARELPAPVTEALGPGVTLVQISTTFCAPCRHARARLGAMAEQHDGLRHVDLDVTHEPEVAHALGVLRTPTTIAYTASGEELLRVSGLPEAPALLGALEPHLATR
ncbi:MAG: thioredoxin family protein [Thermocrispum sp.]